MVVEDPGQITRTWSSLYFDEDILGGILNGVDHVSGWLSLTCVCILVWGNLQQFVVHPRVDVPAQLLRVSKFTQRGCRVAQDALCWGRSLHELLEPEP